MTSIVYAPHEATSNNVGRDYNDNRTTNVKNVVYQDDAGRLKNTLDRLVEHIAPGALHDSSARGPHAPKCHPGTRKVVRQEIFSWIRHGGQGDGQQNILWLSGPVGCGKTAIVGTIADECHEEGLLAASFFFSAVSTAPQSSSTRPLILTLAYALLQQKAIVGLKEAILSIIEDDPAVLHKHLDRQLELLILGPLCAVAALSDRASWPKIIVVDGVNECGGDNGSEGYKDGAARERQYREILSVLAHATADPSFPFRILIASTEDTIIADFFREAPHLALPICLDQKYNPGVDIKLFLWEKLRVIQRKRNLGDNWPSERHVNILVRLASGQFIYATTVLLYLQTTSRPPHEGLERVLRWDGKYSIPLAPLDALYRGIMRTSPAPTLAAKWLVALNEEYHYLEDYRTSSGAIRSGCRLPVEFWYKKAVLESFPGETEHLLGSLSSLVRLPARGESQPIQLHHKSLLDFFQHERRSSNLHVDVKVARKFFIDRHHKILKDRNLHNGLTSNQGFVERFCGFLSYEIDPLRPYAKDDIAWWLAQLSDVAVEHRCGVVTRMFINIDSECTWYHCRPACKIWRNAILRYCEAQSWRRIPVKLDLIRDKLRKFRHGKGRNSNANRLWQCFDVGFQQSGDPAITCGPGLL